MCTYIRCNLVITLDGNEIMNQLLINNEIKIENLIYEVRGIQVMLDSEISTTK